MGLRELVVDANPFYNPGMKIELSNDQQKWLEAAVKAGRFTSVDEAVAMAIADLISLEEDDLAWAKPFVEQARASAARGAVSNGEDYLKRLDARIASLQS
jgi:antitoxin ParD1/3/4